MVLSRSLPRREVLPAFFRLVTDAVLPYHEVAVATDGEAAALWVPGPHS